MKKKVLIVDDSLFMRALLEDTFKNHGYEIVGQAENGETAIELAIKYKPDIITLDNILPDMQGLDVLSRLKSQKNPAKFIIISAVGQKTALDEAKQYGADEYLVKPFTAEKLMETVRRLVK